MHDILDKRHQGAHLHSALIDSKTAKPYDGYCHEIHSHHHKRHSSSHDSVDFYSGACQVKVCVVKASLLVINAVEGAYHPNAGKAFTKDTVYLIQFLLHCPKQRCALIHHNNHSNYDHRNNQNNYPG